MSGYSYALGEEAVHAFTSLSPRQRGRLLRVLAGLTRRPDQSGDYQEAGASGRLYEVKLIDDLLLTWWTDHAVQEIRVVRIELIE